MSWNPFKRSISTSSRLNQPQDLDQATVNASLALGKLLTQFELAESSLKAFYSSVKKVQDHILCTGKFETKLTSELASSRLHIEDENDDDYCQTMDMAIASWRSIALASNTLGENFVITLQRYVIDPMKQLKQAFIDLRVAIRLHDMKQNQIVRLQRKVSKYSEKKKTGKNLVQFEEAKRQLSQAEGDYSQNIQILLNDLTKFLSGSTKLRKPLVEAFAGAELAFMESSKKIVDEQLETSAQGGKKFGSSCFTQQRGEAQSSTSSSSGPQFKNQSATFSGFSSSNIINESFRKLDELSICSSYNNNNHK